jgi:23S rRNA pseudouridine1911/1915/1917 synthase
MPDLLPENVIFEDNHLIAVNKLPGQIVQGDKTGDEPLSEIVKRYIKKKYDKPGEVFTGVIHRLDRPVSGVCLFARTSKALERMNKLFHDREVQKTYWAVVKGVPEKPEDKLIHFLSKNEAKNKSYAGTTPGKNGIRCELDYKVIAKSDRYSLLEVKPLTGRHHQIRVQLSFIGCPIKGDLKYGFPRSNEDGSIHLHARMLEFEHPVKKEQVKIIAPPPDEVLWNFFLKEVSPN